MGQLFAFLYKYRAFFTFLLLEWLCLWMIVAHNNYQRTFYLNTASGLIGTLKENRNKISDYFSLRSVNRELAMENARLHELLFSQPAAPDSLGLINFDNDTSDARQYRLRTAEIIDNSIRNTNNFFTINKGRRDGIAPGMGVINQAGVVGKIRSVSTRYAHGISVLNTKNTLSAKLKKSNRLGTVRWDGTDPKKAKLLFITRDVQVQPGDTVITSSFNAVFPKGLMIGIVSSRTLDPNQRDLDIQIELSVDFSRLSHVYIIENLHKAEQDSLLGADPLEFNE